MNHSTKGVVIVEIRALASSALVRSAVSSLPQVRLWRGRLDPYPDAGEPTTPTTHSCSNTCLW